MTKSLSKFGNIISKNIISIIIISILLTGGSGLIIHDAIAAVPTFVAAHNSTTTTEVIFSEGTNGTLVLANWKVNDITVTAITNGTTYGGAIGHYGGNAVGVLNATSINSISGAMSLANRTIMLTHQVIPTNSSMSVAYQGGNLHEGKNHSASNQVTDGFDQA